MDEAIQLESFGGYDKLKIVQSPVKLTSQKNVVVKMKACGLNFSDIYTRQGIHTLKNIQPPFIMGTEGSGIIHEIGNLVTNFKKGDKVMCWSFDYGLFSNYVNIPAEQCVHIPKNMTFEEAAAIPINYTTAYFAVFGFGKISPGQSILIQCAAGGVGWAATQLANTVPNITSFGTSSPSKHGFIKANGITHPIDYQTSDFVTEVQKISPKGITSAVSGENKNWWNLLKVWWFAKNIKLEELIINNHSICGLHVANLWEKEPDVFKKALKDILQFYKEGKIKPKIDSIWNFHQVALAQQHMIDRKNIGKIILAPDDDY